MRNPVIFNSRFLVPVLAILMATPCAAATLDEQQSANLRDDIRFSRDLARYRFFDLAVDWLAEIEGSSRLDTDSKTEVSLAKATISRLASEYALTREGRKTYYDDAIKHYQEALDSMGTEMTQDKGESTVEGLAKVQVNKGKFYTDEIERLKADGLGDDKIREARSTAEEAFRGAVKTLNAAYSELADLASQMQANNTDEQQVQMITDLSLHALYRKGESYYYWALLYEMQDFNREDYLNKGVESLVDYIWEAGDESIFALYAYYFQGMAEWELGKVQPDQAASHDEKSLASLLHIVSEYGIDMGQLPALAEEERNFVLGLVERTYRGISEVYRAAASRFEASETLSDTDDLTSVAQGYQLVGDQKWMTKAPVFKPALVKSLRGAAIDLVGQLEERASAHRLKLSEEGHRALLAKARALVDAGSAPTALTIAKEVAQSNEGTLVGLEAQSLLGDLLEITDESAQPASVLRLVADGYIAESRWLDAVDALHGLVDSCRSEQDRADFLTAAWNDIGGCYQNEGRNLEAALAFESGFEAAKTIDDELAVGDLALGAYNAWDRRFRETRNDFDKQERNRVRQIVTSLGISGDIQFLVAKEAYSNAAATTKEPAARKKAFEDAVEELAAVAPSSSYYERALVYKARAEAGAGRTDDALKSFKTLLDRIENPDNAVGLDKKKAQQREYASAEAIFYRAEVLLDANKYDEVFDSLEGYEEKFENQAPYFPNVYYFRIRAKAGLDEFAAAEDLLGRMESNFEGHGTVPYAINQVATAFFKAYEAAEDKTTEEARTHLGKAAGYLSRYNQASGYGSFANLRNVADWYKELGELKLAEENYVRLMDKFGKKPEHRKTINGSIKKSLGEVLLELQKFQDALPLWSEVYAANRKDRNVVQKYALCLGGWLQETEDRNVFSYTEITGAGEYKEAMNIWIELKKGIEDAGDKGSDAWWECMTNYLYCQYMLSKTDPQQKRAANGLISNWEALHPDLGGDPWRRLIRKLKRALN